MSNSFWTPERVKFVMNELEKYVTPNEILKRLQSEGCDLGIPAHVILNQLHSEGCTHLQLQGVGLCLRTNDYNVNGADTPFQPCFKIRNSDTKGYKDIPGGRLCWADIFWTPKHVKMVVNDYRLGVPPHDIQLRLSRQGFGNQLPVADTLRLLEAKGYNTSDLKAIERYMEELDYPFKTDLQKAPQKASRLRNVNYNQRPSFMPNSLRKIAPTVDISGDQGWDKVLAVQNDSTKLSAPLKSESVEKIIDIPRREDREPPGLQEHDSSQYSSDLPEHPPVEKGRPKLDTGIC